jgi:accessory colonization factor AcfC
MSRSLFLTAALASAITTASVAFAAEPVHVYGLGGPLPGMKEATAAFESTRGAAVEITADPTPQSIDKAKAEADLVFGGSEVMR